jgi:hypothetical protein
MLDAKAPEAEIRRRLGATAFVISDRDERELKRRGASDALIAFMKQPRGEKNAEITHFAIVLDCSGSMLEPTAEGPTKMEAARASVSELIQKLPADLNVAFIIYGRRKENPCSAVEVVRPMGPLGEDGRKALLEKVRELNGVGATPIALALRTAGKELAKSGAPCGLVLISDGKESCKGNPSAEAAALAKNLPISFGVNVIGFDVKEDERAALEEIAQSGKGKYYSATTSNELAEALLKLQERVREAYGSPQQREDRSTKLAGAEGKPGPFLHNAGLVEAGEVAGKLAMMEAHYYKIAVQKGQEVRAVGQFKKTPYDVPLAAENLQTFSVTIYDSKWAVVDRAKAAVKDNPATLQTARATWKADRDGIVYVGIAASDNHRENGRPDSTHRPESYGLVEKGLEPSAYTLRLRVQPEVQAERRVEEVPQLSANPGSGFEEAGTLLVPGIVGGDIKLGEVAFYRFKAQEGERMAISVGVQKPWFNVPLATDLQATYTLTVYDDDQVEIAKKEVPIELNPADAQTIAIEVMVPLSGNVYLCISAAKSGGGFGGDNFYPEDYKPRPGHLAVRITPAGATTSKKTEDVE